LQDFAGFEKINFMTPSTKRLLEQVESWPQEDQDELAEFVREIEARRSEVYEASPEELEAIDGRSGRSRAVRSRARKPSKRPSQNFAANDDCLVVSM
jgi:hypothetical protein